MSSISPGSMGNRSHGAGSPSINRVGLKTLNSVRTEADGLFSLSRP